MSKLMKAILMRPSQRTMFESSMVGLVFIMIGSLLIAGYLVYTQDSNLFRTFLILSEIGVLSFQYSALARTYQDYRAFMIENNLYSIDQKIALKIEEAKEIIVELNNLVNEKEVKNNVR
jgi:hypothetical protein